MPKHETMTREGFVEEAKSVTRDGVNLGVFEGYLATWDVDTGMGSKSRGRPDRFVQGAFGRSVKDHKSRSNRPIRLRDNHGRVIGGFPIDAVHEDHRGLYGKGEINLDTQLGSEAYALLKQGVLRDLSIGFTSVRDRMEGEARVIEEAIVWECSLVDEPANRNAVVTEVKSARPFADLRVAPPATEWNSDEAAARVDAMPFGQGDGNEAFLCESKQYQIADVIGGELMVVPEALEIAVAELKALDSVDASVQAHVERYYAKMSKPSPFDDAAFYGADEVKSMTQREFEQALRKSGLFSQQAAKLLASRYGEPETKGITADDLVAIKRDIDAMKSRYAG